MRSLNRRSGMTGSLATLASTWMAAPTTATAPTTSSAAGPGDPLEVLATERDPDQQDRDAADEQEGAEVVDRDVVPLHDREAQRRLQDDEGERRDRETGEEAPAPADGVHEDATDERSADRGEREDGADVAAVATALARGDHRGDDDLDERRQAADAEALHDAGADQHLHRRGEAGDERADREDDQRRLHEQSSCRTGRRTCPRSAWSPSSRAWSRRRPRCSRSGCPCRSSTMVGSALLTIVLDSIATNIARRRPLRASST